RAIELVHAAQKPELIIVLATCPTVMIGDNIKNVARKAAKDLGINVVAEMTNGLRHKSPAEVVDNLYSVLSRGAKSPPPELDRRTRVNLVGIQLSPPERAETETILQAMGLTVNVVLNELSALDDFLGVAGAAWNIHPGPNMMLGFDEQCQEKFGQTVIEVPLPFGVDATDRFYRRIGTAIGLDPALVESAIAERRRPAATALAEFRPRLHERIRHDKQRAPRCAFNIGSVRSFDLRRLALEEMGELPFFEELGFDCKLFIQGPQDDANRQRTAGVLAEIGMKQPFAIFPDPGGLAKHLQPGEFDVFFGIDFLADQLSKVNLPLLDKSLMAVGYDAVPHNLERLDAAVFQTFYRQFAPAPPRPEIEIAQCSRS
ncbi:MAG: hypothetical protein HY270_04410, partial [Deltaproteobacteria bacterium]|nr:hypothetical protein [Deltaproteobacteria bacterium]